METAERATPEDARAATRHSGRWIAALVFVVAAIGVPLGVTAAQKKTVVLMGDSLTAIS